MSFILVVTNDAGDRFNVRMVWPGDEYGLERCLQYRVNDQIDGNPTTYHGPMVEFYDASQQGLPGRDPEGYFVSRYFVNNLMDHKAGVGLMLCGYQRHWTVSGRNMDEIKAWVTSQVTVWESEHQGQVEWYKPDKPILERSMQS